MCINKVRYISANFWKSVSFCNELGHVFMEELL